MAQPNWSEADQTSGLEPMVSMPKIVGGIRVAKIDAAFDIEHGGKRLRLRVRERAAFPKANVVAVCLGQRRDGLLIPCVHVKAPVKAEGETGLDALYAAHPTELQLRKLHEQHVFALFSADAFEPEAHAERVRLHKERLDALKETKSALERSALIAEWKYDPRNPLNTPTAEIVGLLSSEVWGDSRVALTM